MTLAFIRCFFVLLSVVVGYYIGALMMRPYSGIWIGLISGLFLILVESRMRRVSVRGLSSMVFGLLLGVFMAKLLSDIINLLPLGTFVHSISRVVLTLIFSYLGTVMALRGKDEFNIIIPYVRFRRQDVKDIMILVDTSAIIDGRIADIYKTHFLSGRLVVPRCVLRELQTLADSSDDLKRERGRRGMDLLRSMQSDPEVDVHIHEDDMPDTEDVDAKLVRLAKDMDAALCTTDYNLGRVAALQGIEVLNVHELVLAVKPTVQMGEEMRIDLVKPGKEPEQAVGYLSDGTMVIVSDAREHIGKEVSLIVTSVLQTQTGKMVFGRISGGPTAAEER